MWIINGWQNKGYNNRNNKPTNKNKKQLNDNQLDIQSMFINVWKRAVIFDNEGSFELRDVLLW